MSGISYKAWVHPSPRSVLLLVHGLGANPAWWEALSAFFLKNNYSLYAIDLRNSDSFESFKNDINALRGIIKKDNPQKKIFAIGESMGSLLILSMALKDKTLFDGLICISPAFKSSAPLKITDYVKIFLPLLYNPKNRYRLPLSADMCTHDTDFINMIEADYNKDVLSTSRVFFDIFMAQTYFMFSKKDTDLPVLFLLAGEDKMVDGNMSKKIFSGLKTQDKALIEYDGMYHSLSIEVGKEKVFQDMFKWIEGRV